MASAPSHSDHHHHSHAGAGAGLTRNQQLVLSVLDKANAPLGAYSILDELRGEGLRAPLQVYRALDKLVEAGLVHRLESLNAFVACVHPHCHASTATVFAICEKCGSATEFPDEAIGARLFGWARDNAFAVAKTTVEIKGVCARCAAAGGAD
ncbi:transcriptional repressor [Aureimonas endophytica]|uniref:Transcriptional repressor n=1 Tax=Aureimonas endophytica TaxID=2027858 RepID=A0A917EBR3_9HYPH|nr:Fur family transcriptional regulator [Aureimonas endophytica]GGE17754.1 transcriptional repressor [Aureimonas endophytica]